MLQRVLFFCPPKLVKMAGDKRALNRDEICPTAWQHHLFPWFISRWTMSLLTLLCCAYAWAKYACIFWSQTDPGSLRVFFDSQFSILWSFLAPQAIFCSYGAPNGAKTMFSMHFPPHNRLKTVKNFPPAAGYCIFPVRYDRPAEWKSPLTKVCVSAEHNITYRRPNTKNPQDLLVDSGLLSGG